MHALSPSTYNTLQSRKDTKFGISTELGNTVRQVRFSYSFITVYHGISDFSSGHSSKFPKDFSVSCRSHFEKYILSHKPKCLFQAVIPKNITANPVCGNQILEVGEDCDCGSLKVWKYPWFQKLIRESLWLSVFFSLFFFF